MSEETENQDTGAEAVAGVVAGADPAALTISGNYTHYIAGRPDIAKGRQAR
jgi:hypothetical protein